MELVQMPDMREVPVREILAGEIPDGLEARDVDLWYKQQLSGAVGTEQEFFHQGHQDGLDDTDTNVVSAGQLPGDQSFACDGVIVRWITEDEDDHKILEHAMVDLEINSLSKWHGLAWRLGGGGGVGGLGQGQDHPALIQPGMSSQMARHMFRPGFEIAINGQTPFRVKLKWNNGGGNLNAATWVWVHLTGVLVGNVDHM